MNGAWFGRKVRRERDRWAVVAAGLGALWLLAPLAAAGQTIRPVIVEYKERARARFEVVNDTLFPLNAVLEPRSFSINEDGEPTFRPLDSNIRLRLSAMSFRIPAQSSYYIIYEARADALPAWFVIYCTLAGLPRQSGLNIQLELPHTVYLLQKEALSKSDIKVRQAEYQPREKRVVIELENQSGRLGRVLMAEVRARKQKQAVGGFPLLPHSLRRFLIPWGERELPQKLVVRFNNFTVQEEMNGP